MIAPVVADLPFDAALLVGALDAGTAVEGINAQPRAENGPPLALRLDAAPVGADVVDSGDPGPAGRSPSIEPCLDLQVAAAAGATDLQSLETPVAQYILAP